MGGYSHSLPTSLIFILKLQALSVILQMTFSAFFMSRLILTIHIIIRLLIILSGLFIEFNGMNLNPEQHDSVLWIGRIMIVFGTLRLIWLYLQQKQRITTDQQHEDREI